VAALPPTRAAPGQFLIDSLSQFPHTKRHFSNALRDDKVTNKLRHSCPIRPPETVQLQSLVVANRQAVRLFEISACWFGETGSPVKVEPMQERNTRTPLGFEAATSVSPGIRVHGPDGACSSQRRGCSLMRLLRSRY